MDKVVVKLYVPFIEEAYDVKIPLFLTVGEIIPLLTKSIATLSDGRFYVKGNEILCVKEKNILLDYRHYLYEYGIRNGDMLVLF